MTGATAVARRWGALRGLARPVAGDDGPDLSSLATALRWGTLSLAILDTLAVPVPGPKLSVAIVMILYAVLRTVQPLRAGAALSLRVGAEVLLCLSAVAMSGGWRSPFLLSLGGALVIAGLLGRLAGVAVLMVAAATALVALRGGAAGLSFQHIGSLGLAGAVGAYARRVLQRADRTRGEEVARLRNTEAVHTLLLELYSRVARGPVTAGPPDVLGDTLGDTLGRLRTMVDSGSAPTAFSPVDAALVDEVARHCALAVDSVKWYGRVRTLSATAERERIARDLHDRVGQSLASAALGLDVLRVRAQRDPAVPPGLAEALADLAVEVRSATRGVREELTDLRAETTPGIDLPAAMAELLDAVRSRSGMQTELVCATDHRLPAPVEQEIWRIAQEAVINAERHSGARRITVRWQREGCRNRLEVLDDGDGFDPNRVRTGAYGLIGMRERAETIRGLLVVEAGPAGGTAVSLSVGDHPG